MLNFGYNLKEVKLPVPEIIRDMEKEFKIIENYYPGVEKLINDEAVMRGEFENEHDFQLFIALHRMFAEGTNSELPELYDSIFRTKRVGQCI